jgi:hypothetical protein
MYDGVIEKPELNEETLAHYGIKGMKWKNHKAKILEEADKEKKQSSEEIKEQLNALFNKKKETTLDILNRQKTKSLMKLTSGKGSSSSSKSKETDKKDSKDEDEQTKETKKSQTANTSNELTDEEKKAKYEAYAKKRDAYIKKKKNLRDEYITKKKAYMARYKRKG